MSYPRSVALWTLGIVLRQARRDAVVTVDSAARRAGIPAARMYAIEAGRLPPTPQVAEYLCGLYAMSAPARTAVTHLARDGAADAWWYANRSVIPPGDGLHLSLEAAAARIRSYDPVLPPAVLQTDDYAYALYTRYLDATPDRTKRRLTLHRQRRAAYRTGRGSLDVILDETVLHRLAAPGTVNVHQLAHLLAAAGTTARTVRIIPAAAGLHPGSAVGGFVIYDFPDLTHGVPAPTIVYRPGMHGAVYLDTTETVAPYLHTWTAMASTTEESCRWRHLTSRPADLLAPA